MKTSYAAYKLAWSPFHAFKVLDYKARPYEKDKFQGLNFSSTLFIAFKNNVASSSANPPDKKLTPGNALGIVLLKVLIVYHATSPILALWSAKNSGF